MRRHLGYALTPNAHGPALEVARIDHGHRMLLNTMPGRTSAIRVSVVILAMEES